MKFKNPKCLVTSKTGYSEQVAKKEAVRFSNKANKIRAYKCEFCPDWHLTHGANNFLKH